MRVLWLWICVQTHQVVYIKFVQLFACQSYTNKVDFKEKTSGNPLRISSVEITKHIHGTSFPG